MVSPLNFRKYAGWPVKATSAQGRLVLSRDDQVDDSRIILIPPEMGVFHDVARGVQFKNSENVILGSSSKMVEFPVITTELGSRTNIPAQSLWNVLRITQGESGDVSAYTGFTLNNPVGFSGGGDAQGIQKLSDIFIQQTTDEQIQKYLDIAKSIILDMLGYEQTESLPDNVRVENAVNFLCLFLLENRSTQERALEIKFGSSFSTERKTSYFRGHLESAIYRRIVGLINPWRRVQKFMPEVPA